MSLGTPAVTGAVRRAERAAGKIAVTGARRGGLRARRIWRAGLLVALTVGLPACAYFNTFYYAKKHYAKAQRLEQESKTERLSPEAVKLYDKAIEKAAKVIFEHGGGWRAGIDDALLLMGACYFGKRDYETAIGKFDELLDNYPDSPHAAEALFYKGRCYHELRNHTAGNEVFDRLLDRYPDFERRDEILLISAREYETAGDDAGALRQYARLLVEFRHSRHRGEALARVGGIHFDEGRYDSALVAYEELARTTRDDTEYIEAQLDAGACLTRMGRPEEALSLYERILPSEPERNELAARVWLAMADAENRSGRHDRALEDLGYVISYYESRPEGTEAQFQIGYTNEVYLEDYEAARTAYQAAAASRSRSVFKDQAARRLQNLDYLVRMKAEGDSLDTDRNDRAQAALRVAEFTLFENQDRAGALTLYADIARSFPESPAALRAAYAQAWIYSEHPELDTLGLARDLLLSLAAKPETPQAGGAVELLASAGEPESLLAPLRAAVRSARLAEALRDSIARADSLADVQARADSVAALRAQADSLAAARAAERASAQEAAGDREETQRVETEEALREESPKEPPAGPEKEPPIRAGTGSPDSLEVPPPLQPAGFTAVPEGLPADSTAAPEGPQPADSTAAPEGLQPADSTSVPDTLAAPAGRGRP